jgi:hypothetical protein
MQIVEHEDFEDLSRLDDQYAHYVVNSHSFLALEYASGEHAWTFEFEPDRLEMLRKDRARARVDGEVFLALICGRDGICLLKPEEWDRLLEFGGELDAPQQIVVERPFRHQMEVAGTHGELDHKIARKRFPGAMFESSAEEDDETEPIQLQPTARISPAQ